MIDYFCGRTWTLSDMNKRSIYIYLKLLSEELFFNFFHFISEQLS